MLNSYGRSILAGAALCCAASAAHARIGALGGEFRLDPAADSPEKSHSDVGIVRKRDGGFVASWTRHGFTIDGSDRMAQVFAGDGSPVSPPVYVNQQAGIGIGSSLGVDQEGGFAVAWAYQDNREGSLPSAVFVRRFDAAGLPRGDEQEVAQGAEGSMEELPALAMAPDGRFLVAWRQGSSILGRLYDAAGGAGSTLQLADLGESDIAAYPAVAMKTDGSFIVAYWYSLAFRPGRSYLAVRGFDAHGQMLFGPVPVDTASRWSPPALGIDDEGRFHVAWISALDGQGAEEVRLRRFDASGTALAALARADAKGAWPYVALGVSAAGDATVAWMDADRATVLARSYDAAGVADGEPYVVGAGSGAQDDFWPALRSRGIAYAEASGFLMAWTCDARPFGLCARRFGPVASVPEPESKQALGDNQVGAPSAGGLLVLLAAARIRRRRAG
jgi:hypothetical protein